MKSKIDIFRPLAAISRGCRGGSSDDNEPVQAPLQQCTTIFRKSPASSKDRGVSTSASGESFVLSTNVWPPPDIPGSESIDSKSSEKHNRKQKQLHKLGRSPPIQVSSSDSRGTPSRSSAGHHQQQQPTPPSYYKFEMQGDLVQLSAGDDNSIQITPEHNEQIKLTGSKNRNITRASPVVESAPSSSSLPLKASDMGHKWKVSETGDIVAVPLGSSSCSESAENYHSNTTKSASDCKLGVPSLKDSYSSNNCSNDHQDDTTYSAPPLLTQASSDSGDSADNELVLPESPPPMNRSLLGHKSLFQEDGSRSSKADSSSKHSKTSKTSTTSSSGDNRSNTSRNSNRGGGCGIRLDLMSQVIDFFSLACGTSVCKSGCFSKEQTNDVVVKVMTN
jgi:hypothetical protein